MKIVTVTVAVRSDEDAEQLAEELFNDVRAMYDEAEDDVEPLAASIREPTHGDMTLLAERRGEDPSTTTPAPVRRPPALSKHHRDNFDTLVRAWENRAVALVSAIRATPEQEPVALICAMQRNRDGTITPVPFAEMVNGNPFELYHDPTDSPASFLPTIKEGPAEVEKKSGVKARRKGR